MESYVALHFSGRARRIAVSLFRLMLIFGISYIILFPVLSKVSAAFMSQQDLYDTTVKWIPRTVTFDNIVRAFRNMQYPDAFVNSFILAISVSILQLVSCTLVGYGFARFNFKGSGFLFGLVLLSLIIPPQLNMISLYLNFRFFNLYGLLPSPGINLLNTYWPYIMMAITGTGLRNGLFIYIMRQFFKGMPTDLEEAAYVDGAGTFKTFYAVMLPGAVPALVVVFLFSFVWQWNDYFMAQIFVPDSLILPHTLNSLVERVVVEVEAAGNPPPGGVTDQYGHIINNTGMLLFIIPLLILYGVMQRYFVESVERVGLVE